MENPNSWTETHKIIEQILQEQFGTDWSVLPTKRKIVGASSKITLTLIPEGKFPEDKPEWTAEKAHYRLEPDETLDELITAWFTDKSPGPSLTHAIYTKLKGLGYLDGE